MNRLKDLALHPFVFAIYPVLALLAHNIEEVDARMALRSLLVVLFATALLLFLTRWLLREWRKAGLVTTATLITFFSYGHVYALIEGINISAQTIGRHRILLPLTLLLWGLAVVGIVRYKGNLGTYTQALNWVALIAVLLPLVNLSQHALNSYLSAMSRVEVQASDVSQVTKPDIYYIVLDGYSRDDVLADDYDYDNSGFLNELESLGFYVPRCAQSNYAQTQLSLASTLNMNYLQSLNEGYSNPQRKNRAGIPHFIQKSAVRQFLEGSGYKIIGFDSGYSWTNLTDADFFLSARGQGSGYLGILGAFNDFEVMLIQTSGALVLKDAALKLPLLLNPETGLNRLHRERVLFTLDNLTQASTVSGPKFVFAHIVSPHEPFVIDANGGIPERQVEIEKGYREQVAYLNSRLIPILEGIIEQSTSPPVIIVQADHGSLLSNPQDRMRILNAYYLTDKAKADLYKEITPVNTFRLIFNNYLGTDYRLLEDVAYYSPYNRPFDFRPIRDSRPGCD